VHAFAFERVQIGGKRRNKGLALAGLHLGDLSAVQHHAADELDVEVPHVEDAAAGFADDGKSFDKQIVQGIRRRLRVCGIRWSSHGAGRR